MNYYKSELDRLKDTEYYKTIIVSDGENQKTKTLSLTNKCLDTLIDWLKHEKQKLKKILKHKLIQILENDYHFRDYTIKSKSNFGKSNKVAIHQMVDLNNISNDVENAINNFNRDGFGHIVFYI